MVKKGSITVFLALMLGLVLSLVCTSIESVRMAAARTQILNSLDIGLYSLFGQYDKTLLKDYDLFLLDGSGSGGTLDMASVYDNMESYIKPVLKQNSQKLSIKQGGLTGYRLVTDDNGEVFYQQVIRYMKDTLGSQGVQLLLEKMQDREKKTQEAEEKGSQMEEGNVLESYDSEMDAASENSHAAAEEAAKQENGSGQPDEIFGSGQVPVEIKNPIPIIRRIRKMGILELLIPGGREISENEISMKTLVSRRNLEQGMPMAMEVAEDLSYTSQILFQQYLMTKLGNFLKPAKNGLRYQAEYVLCGKDSDVANLKSVAKRLLLVREGVNLACLAADGGKRAQVEGLSLAIASGFLIPPAAAVIEAALLLCWSFAESVLDVRELFDGGKIPLVKSPGDWQLSLSSLPELLGGLDTERKSCESGISYEDYLQILLLTLGKENKVKRGMDMVELSIRSMEGREGFRLDHCIVALEASVDVEANKRKTFTVTRQYCYD